MRSFRIGCLLGLRQIQRASTWTTILIVTVMMLTFLNLVAVSGILVGLITGAERAVQEQYIGDLQITPLLDEDRILHTNALIAAIESDPYVDSYAVRYTASGAVEANYRTRRDLRRDRDLISGRISGIDPVAEQATTRLADNVVEGDYLEPGETGYILIGSLFVERYTEDFPDIMDALTDVHPGDTVRVTINDATQEFTVKGIVDAKVNEVRSSMYITDQELRRLAGRPDRNADTIAITTNTEAAATAVQTNLINAGYGNSARIRTFAEAMPRFIMDIKDTFNILGVVIGSIGIVVASITIFIIIFINAISRRRQIGILKGIGIDRRAIEIAYVLQAAFYVILGSLLGAILIYGYLIGYFDRNPLDFPFSDGILVAEPSETLLRFGILFVVTLIAGFIPAWLICRQNTLNAILGRN